MNAQPELERGRGAARWVVLALMSLVIFANYYLYDCFSTLKETLQTELRATSTQWGLVRNCYSFPNVFLFMVLLGGIFLDRFGIRKTGFVATLFCALGGVLTAYGASDAFLNGGFGYGLLNSFLPDWSPGVKMMMLGRILFGLGAETQIVMLNKVLAKWFLGKELALAFGINLGVARVGSALGMSQSPRVAEAFGFTAALWLGAVVMGAGLILFLVYMVMDLRDERIRGAARGAAALAPGEEFHFSTLVALFASRPYILITLLCATFYAVVFPFQDYLADLLTHKYGFNAVKAGDFTSLVPWGAAVFTIIFGAFVDRKGKRATLMLGGALLLLLSSLCFGLTMLSPWILVPVFGIAFSLVPAAMWPAVALIVEEKKLGTAYGFMAWVQNLLWWMMPPLVGKVLDTSNPGVTPETLEAGTGVYDYTATMMAFSALAAVALIVAIAQKLADRGKATCGLELPSAEAAAFNKARREQAG
ncbi:MAG: MFS transporter [Planctomycetes bacterium]|nr:MFS transporter [Planctomycetota bacterium]